MLFTRKNVTVPEDRVPVSGAAIETTRIQCLALVKKRAAMSAAVAAVPVPGLDLLADITGFAALVDQINAEFGLTQKQIERLNPRMRVIAYKAAASVGGMLVGKLVTRGAVARLFRVVAGRMAVKTTAKMVPLAGQIASAAIGYTLFKRMGAQHVEACVKVVQELERAESAGEAPQPVEENDDAATAQVNGGAVSGPAKEPVLVM
ncbi:uncharacterized protein (DUF697 family) [Massilia sp. UYP32]|uniref:hypothetical protein n=1 Tax=unclassified Massilia TaxID=2609279 RepID=UPI001C62ED8B|nr:hypothetical protein [Massilia sp. NP310]QYG00435.1 hypothetical protein KY496_18910 [Massilia sp. NP310]